MDEDAPLVSIICTNFNKGDWIRDAIESFLSQKTDFKYEILLIDDKSTDKSPEIIKEYTENYPDKIKAFYNKKNLGIVRTWKKICKEATGKYIARCDGDDYWIDDEKLQKQVDLLKKSKDSKWCCTDYDIITPEGVVTHRFAVKTGYINRPKSYPEMLATRGLTMASTWLVDTDLMRDINSELSDDAIDDTFNIQLDLFNKTKLTFLPDSTAVFRMNIGSDSRPVDEEATRLRDQRLMKTQLEYIEKYKGVGYFEIIEFLLQQSIDGDKKQRQIDRQDVIIETLKNKINFANEVIAQKDKQLFEIVHSKRYIIGGVMAMPVNKTKSILNNIRKKIK